MRTPRLSATALLLAALGPSHAVAQAQEAQPALEARVWLDRGEEPVLRRGDQVRVYYRASEDAHAAIFRIDTDGGIQMVFPQHPGAIEPVRGGRDYRLLFPDAPAWPVTDDPGVGYFFMIASPEPLDFSAFPFDPRTGWDLGAVGGVVYEDPYVAIDDYVAALVPDWEYVPYGLDFLTYHVENTYAYPRFLCYDCHTRQSYTSWNPYDVVCTSFRVVIWDDPYFYPSYRYAGTRVVVARPARALPRYELVTRGPGDIGVRPLVRARTPPERRVAQFKESPTVDPSTRVPVRRPSSPPATAQTRAGSAAPGSPRAGDAGSRPTLQRRSGAPLPVRTPPAAAGRAPIARGEPSSGGRAAPSAERRAEPARPERASPGRDAPARAAPTRPPPTRPEARSGASRPESGRTGTPRSSRPRESPPRSAPERTPSRPNTRPSAPAPSRPSARPSAPAPSRPSARPSAPAPSRPSARPPARVPAPSRPSARPSAPREPSPRPSVQPRGRTGGS